jgi:hypothetical protein
MLPQPSRLKCVSSETYLIVQGSYKDGDHKTQEEGVQKGIQSEPIKRNRPNKKTGPYKGHMGLSSRWEVGILRKGMVFPVIQCCSKEESGTV